MALPPGRHRVEDRRRRRSGTAAATVRPQASPSFRRRGAARDHACRSPAG